MQRRMGRSITALATLALAATVAACAPPAASTPSTTTPGATATTPPTPTASMTDTGRLDATVEVDGRSIHVLCRGERPEAAPTLWLEPGLGGSIGNWASVMGSLSAMTRVCTWDRPGAGDSDPPPATDRTVEDVVDDLEATIDGAGIAGPFVIVAHSMGPWVATVFADRRPDDVAGLVLVDPRGPEVSAAHLAALGEPTADEPAALTAARDVLADAGFDDNVERLVFGPSEAAVEAILAADGPAFGDRPVVVLAAERTLDDFPAIPAAMRDAWWRIWLDGQRRYAAESTAGAFELVPGSGHLMMDDRPRAVIDAVAALLDDLAGADRR